jgi:hypothetical protein
VTPDRTRERIRSTVGKALELTSRREQGSLHRCRQLRRTAGDRSPWARVWQRLDGPVVAYRAGTIATAAAPAGGAATGEVAGVCALRGLGGAEQGVGSLAAGGSATAAGPGRSGAAASAPRVLSGPRLTGCPVRTLLGTLSHTSRAPGRSRILTPRTSRSPRARGPPRGNDPSGAPAGNLDRPRARPSIDLPLEARS